ncbi:MAG: RHS repeat-associated core domain-containing protein [Nanoarchaeota archaeon]|nr:RHS repeat-associated core domain-containing protein [Nanoarchaeota archaeon]
MAMLIMMIPIVHATELNLVYDANGNLISGDGKFREFNSLNQLVRIRDNTNVTILEEYVHDPIQEKILVKRIYNSSAQVAETVYYVDENFVRVVNSTGSYDFTYVKHEGQLVAQLNPGGSKYFMHADHEGSTSVVTNSSAGVVENTLYSPHGEILSGGSVSRFDSEGKEYSSVTGDTDFNFRKMNPSWGLFLQPDTLIKKAYNPQNLNRYSFEENSPYGRTDPDGHAWQFVVAGIIGAGWNIYNYHASHEVHTTKGYIGYGSAGAVAGASSLTGPEGAAGGGVVATGIERYVDDKELFSKEAFIEYGTSAAISGATFGLGKFLPQAKTWLIKSPSSYLTTKTGGTFITNQIVENIVNSVLNSVVQTVSQGQSGGGSSRSVFSGSSSGSSGQISSLVQASMNAPNQTAGSIIKAWRAQQKK